MINDDMLSAAKTLLKNLKILRTEMEALNSAVMAAMDSESPKDEMRNLFPMILEVSEKAAPVISEAFLSVDWEKDGNEAQLLYDILGGMITDLPEDLAAEVDEHLKSLDGSEKQMNERFGDDPISACLESLGLGEELAAMINSRDEVQALMSALQDTPEVPLVIQG